MKTKTFKIGEYAKGGIITVEIQGDQVTVIGKDWDVSTGTRRSSNQSNAKEFTRATFTRPARPFWGDGYQKRIIEKLNDLTTSYYADEVYNWIESQFKTKQLA